MNIDGLDDFTVLQDQFRTKVLQHQISQQLPGKSASSVTEKTVSCRNCKLPHRVNECRKLCYHTSCTASPAHPAKDCSNWKTVKSKAPPISFSSPNKVSVSPASKAKKAVASSPVVSSVSPDTEVIFDSGSVVTTLSS